MGGLDEGSAAQAHVAQAEVRGRSLSRQAALQRDGGRTVALVDPRTGPRLWARTARVVQEGFEQGLEAAAGRPASVRLQAAVGSAREALVAFCRTLVERTPPDANLVAFVLDDDELAGVVVGGGRIYQHRKRYTERLSPREVSEAGLLRSTGQPFRVAVAPDTILFAGTETAFSAEAIAQSAHLLEQGRRLAPGVLATALTGPAEQAGTGAAAAVLKL